jgi:hypothetical protein
LLRKYKQGFSPNCYTVNFIPYGGKEEQYKVFSHNEGIDFVIEYIKDLEKKVDELQWVEKIIQAAKETNYD